MTTRRASTALLGVASDLAGSRPASLRVVLLSAGSEETMLRAARAAAVRVEVAPLFYPPAARRVCTELDDPLAPAG